MFSKTKLEPDLLWPKWNIRNIILVPNKGRAYLFKWVLSCLCSVYFITLLCLASLATLAPRSLNGPSGVNSSWYMKGTFRTSESGSSSRTLQKPRQRLTKVWVRSTAISSDLLPVVLRKLATCKSSPKWTTQRDHLERGISDSQVKPQTVTKRNLQSDCEEEEDNMILQDFINFIAGLCNWEYPALWSRGWTSKNWTFPLSAEAAVDHSE